MKPGSEALWHRRGHLPRPVLVMKRLPVKVRVLDLCTGDAHHLVLRDIQPSNLTTKGRTAAR